MDIKPYDKTIKEILLSGRQFSIPRFQREYSWEKKNYIEFYEDMINCLQVSKGKIKADQYFLGTMLFIGNYAEGSDKEIEVVDGQQRLTTITILFSALSDRFRSINQETLSEQIFKYIMTKDDNGDDVRVLKSKTHYPFFSYYIQDRSKKNDQKPVSEEEICIQETYQSLYSRLEEKVVKLYLKKRWGAEDVEQLKYVDILKALRDQVLQTTFVSISTTDKDQATKIFEILNAKGKRLAHVDLIKNKIFEVLDETEPADFAEEQWGKIKKVLNDGKESVGLATFYRHFWISTYKKSSANKMYDDFNKIIKPKIEERFTSFLKEMERNALNYMKIINPKREDYGNRKEYYWLVQSLNVITNYFNIVQARVAILALFELKDAGIIDLAIMKKTIIYLENFHFAYNSIVSGRSNRFESIYATFSIEVRKAKNKIDAKKIIESLLIKPMDQLFPQFDDFNEKFMQLTYTKKDNPNNVKVKYIINKICCNYSNTEIFFDDGSIEHIIPETDGDHALNIGNLILLEVQLNRLADKLNYREKKKIYKKSKYVWVEEFINNNKDWNKDMIYDRTVELSKIYYTKILGKRI